MLTPDRLEFRFVEVAREGEIAVLTISDPPANTLTYHLVLQLEEAFVEFASDPTVRAVVVTGAGSRFFCGGVNIGMLSNVSAHYNSNFLNYAGEVFELIDRSPLLVVAAINGHVTGGGLELALVADRRIACEGTYNLGFPEARLGVIPGLGGTQRLSHLIGPRCAFDMIAHAEFISVARAKELGIVDEVVPKDIFLARAIEYTRQTLSGVTARPRDIREKSAWQRVGGHVVAYQRHGAVGVITLSAACASVPCMQALWALNQAILTARHDDDAEAILILSDGDEIALGSEADLDEPTRAYAEYIFRRLQNTPRLCVLALRGALTPLATELALACDFRVASPELGRERIVFNVAADSTRCNPRQFTVAQAERVSLLKTAGAEPWPQAAVAWMSRFVSPRGASKALGYAKLAIVKGCGFPEEAGRMLEWHLQEQLFRGHDAPEGMRAYLEKRTATFKGE
jgi:enoyl-CoA hydratase/carnithine racemase